MSVNTLLKITESRKSSLKLNADFCVWSISLQQKQACAAVIAALCYALNFGFVLRCEFTDNYTFFFGLTLFHLATWLWKIILQV